MSLRAPRHRYTYGDYLATEEGSPVRHEFYDGEIYAMAGGTPDHAALVVKVAAALLAQLADRPCRVMSSDLRFRVLATGLATYPDVTVVCGPLKYDPEGRNTVVNPTLVVEVLSAGTEAYDRGEKFEHYQRIPSLQECVFVSHRERQIESWRREPGGDWSHRAAGAGQTLRVEALGCVLVVDDVYRGVLDIPGT